MKSSINPISKFVFGLGVLAVGASTALAVTFDFEGQALGTYGSISQTVGSLTIAVTPNGQSTLDVVGPLGPASWGNRSLIAYGSGGTGLVVDFSSAVNSAGIQFGDYDADDDPVTFNAYAGLDGTGALLGTTSLLYPISKNISNGDADVGSLSVAASGIMSFVVTSGGAYPGSVYWDNVTADVGASAPDGGATFLLMVLAMSGMVTFKRLTNRRTSLIS